MREKEKSSDEIDDSSWWRETLAMKSMTVASFEELVTFERRRSWKEICKRCWLGFYRLHHRGFIFPHATSAAFDLSRVTTMNWKRNSIECPPSFWTNFNRAPPSGKFWHFLLNPRNRGAAHRVICINNNWKNGGSKYILNFELLQFILIYSQLFESKLNFEIHLKLPIKKFI